MNILNLCQPQIYMLKPWPPTPQWDSFRKRPSTTEGKINGRTGPNLVWNISLRADEHTKKGYQRVGKYRKVQKQSWTATTFKSSQQNPGETTQQQMSWSQKWEKVDFCCWGRHACGVFLQQHNCTITLNILQPDFICMFNCNINTLHISLLFSLFPRGRASLGSPGCPKTHYIGQAALNIDFLALFPECWD